MPNRIIKESICLSRKVNLLTPEEEVMFYRLIVNCDDFGAFYGNPVLLSGRLFPRKQYAEKIVKKWRDRLVEVGLIFVYSVDGEEYIQVNKWHEHQRQRTVIRKYPEPVPESNDGQMSVKCPSSDSISPPNPILSYPIQSNPKEKKLYGEYQNVLLSEEDLVALRKDMDEETIQRLIEKVSRYQDEHPKKQYKNFRSTIRNFYENENKWGSQKEQEFEFHPEEYE